MPISARSDAHAHRPNGERGLTLVELLATLSVLSFGATIAVHAVNASSSERAVNQIAEQLVADLKRARMTAQMSGETQTVQVVAAGYSVNETELRAAGRGVLLETDAANSAIVFTRSFADLGGVITIKRGKSTAVIEISPVTGKVERVD